MRVAKRSSPGSYRRMRIPNASPSPPRTWATTATSSETPSFTIRMTHRRGPWSRAAHAFPCNAEKGRSANAGARYASGERLQRRLGAAAIGGIARDFPKVQEKPGGGRIGAGEHIVQKMLGAIAKGGPGRHGRSRRRRRRQRHVVIAADRIGICALQNGG